MKKHIFAVDDEESIRELYAVALANAGFEVSCFPDGESLFSALKETTPALILLDIMLDGDDGYAILEKIKAEPNLRDIPVIMVSAKGEEMGKVRGLNLGADDYIAKPFGVLELVARINANLRRTTQNVRLLYADIAVDEAKHEITVGGVPLTLTLKEYDLLKLLVGRAGQVIPREEILVEVWGETFFGESRTLDVHIASLRRSLAKSEAQIATVRGVGYCLK